MSKFRAAVSATLIGIAGFGATPLGAQSASAAGRSNTAGMVVGAHAGAVNLGPDGGSSNTGFGVGALIGYGFNKNVALYVGFDLGKVDLASNLDNEKRTYNLTHLDFGARYSFANQNRALVPYLGAVVSGRGLTATISGIDLKVTGLGFGGGGGIQYFVNPNVAIDLGLMYETGKFDKKKVNNIKTTLSDAGNSSSTRISVGVRYYPHISTLMHK